MKRLFLSGAVLLLSFVTALAQDGSFKFTEEKHDFGLIEEGVQATYEFEFVNTGSTPITISDVRPSCGCTTPEWPKEPVGPGQKGTIKASYNSQGRPGVFNKSITITSNSVEPTKVLFIKGIVEKKEEKEEPSAEDLKNSATINLNKEKHHFGKIERGQKVSLKVEVKNTGKEALSINSVKAACGCVSHNIDGEIPAGETGELEIIYSPYYDGPNTDKIIISSNDINNPKSTVTLSADVVESLSSDSPVKEEGSAVPFK
ncbi:DUF1573 domain-containing protein [Cytophagaceae bacterium ABcell3]|nr:DUF1573 domain-containing protein [Cytophagaceae bacterium ABcell3]